MQVLVDTASTKGSPLNVFHDVTEAITVRDGRPAATAHAVLQLSSGSTGPSKVIGRTAADLAEEVHRYTLMDGVPQPGERIILLPSMVHVLGLVGGLLYGLHAGVELVPPRRLTGDSILEAVASGDTPATVLGVPFHIGLLNSVADAEKLPQLKRMTTGGELVPAAVSARFDEKYGVPLGNMWGMTELGVIATDLFGEHRPALMPAPGIEVREVGRGAAGSGGPSRPTSGCPIRPGGRMAGCTPRTPAGSTRTPVSSPCSGGSTRRCRSAGSRST